MTKNKIPFAFMAVLLSATVLFSACKKDNNNDNNTTPAATSITIDSEMQISCKINGTAVSYKASEYPVTHSTDKSLNPPNPGLFAFGSSFLDVNSNEMFGIDKGTLHSSGNPADETLFQNFFAQGNYSYSANDVEDYQGVIIRIRYNGTLYSTILGSTSQNGSAFKIDANKYVYSGYGYMKIKAAFNCILYDAGGSSITLTEGIVVTDFGNI